MRFAASLCIRTVGNTPSPILHTTGTTFCSRRILCNRLRSISQFSSPPVEAAWSDMKTVTDSFHCYWVYPASPPAGLVPLLGYSYNPLIRLAHYSLRRPSACHGRTTRLRSVVILYCLCGGSQHLSFLSNVRNTATVYSGPCSPIILLSLSVTFGFISGYNNYLFCWCLRQGFSC